MSSLSPVVRYDVRYVPQCNLEHIRHAQVKVGLRLERRYSQRQNFAISPVDDSVCQEKFGIHSIAAVCC